MTCAEWEIAIEKRGHEALASSENAALQAHLAGCASCRAYAGLAHGMERTMQTAGAELDGRIDWQRVRAEVEQGARRARHELWAGGAWALFCIAVVPWRQLLAAPIPLAVLVAALVPAALLCAIVYRQTRGRALSAGASRASDAAALGWLREELNARIRGRRRALFLEVAACAVVAAVALLEQVPDRAWLRLVLVAGVVLVFGDAGWAAFRALPRLERERAELGE